MVEQLVLFKSLHAEIVLSKKKKEKKKEKKQTTCREAEEENALLPFHFLLCPSVREV